MNQKFIRDQLDKALYIFSNIDRENHLEAINCQKISQFVKLNSCSKNFRGPFVKGNKVVLHANFISYLWGIIYFCIFTIKAMYNEKFCTDTGELNLNITEVGRAYKLFTWSISLKENNLAWDLTLPNPKFNKHISNFEKNIIEDTNVICPVAITYLLFHEFAHLNHHHMENKRNNEVSFLELKEYEKEADTFARRMLIENESNEENQQAVSMAIVIANLSLLFLINDKFTIVGNDHPDIDNRIYDALSDVKSIVNENFYKYLVESIVNMSIRFFTINKIDIAIKDHYKTSEEALKVIFDKFDEIKNIHINYLKRN